MERWNSTVDKKNECVLDFYLPSFLTLHNLVVVSNKYLSCLIKNRLYLCTLVEKTIVSSYFNYDMII